MLSIWSERKSINVVMNVLLVLLSMNFLHYGQLLLPIMCLILFVDRRFKFKVNNVLTFIILCLFGVTFFAFSYKLGFYCVMGFCLPMAYYVGSNLKVKSEDSIKAIIYIIALGMAIHCILNFSLDIKTHWKELFAHQSRYDFWLQDKTAPTTAATNLCIPLSLMYFVFKYEKNKVTKIIWLIIFVLLLTYNVYLGRRIPLLLGIFCFASSFLYDSYNQGGRKFNYKKLLKTLVPFVLVVIIFIIFHTFNIGNIKGILWHYSLLYKRFVLYGFKSGRLELLINAIKLLPYHLLGGQEIGLIIGDQIHETWLDIYDYAGIVPYVLFVIYSFSCLSVFVKLIKNSTSTNEFKVLIFGVFIFVTGQLFSEPIMTGSSVLLICSVIIFTTIEKIDYQKTGQEEIRVLQYGMSNNKGGIENVVLSWLKNMPKNVHFDFLNDTDKPLAYENELMKRGCKIHKVTYRYDNPIKRIKELKQIIKNGNYDYVHLNTMTLNEGSLIVIANNTEGCKPIVHCHSMYNGNFPLKERVLLLETKLMLIGQKYLRLSCSNEAGKTMFEDGKFDVIYNGIDTKKFKYDIDQRNKIRKKYNIKKTDYVIGHVGHICSEKNYEFIIKTFSKLVGLNKKYKLLLIGNVENDVKIRELIANLDIEKNVIFTGVVNTVKNYYSAMDLFFMPSTNEGFGIAVVEAQLTGLPCVVSDAITEETKISDSIYYLPINENIMVNKINELANKRIKRKTLVNYEFDIKKTSKELYSYYIKNLSN